ncbi:hypothetical protein C3L33_04536, partial [Rhododendron williamsianum]
MYEEASMADCDERVMEWEVGLPSAEDLTPLSQPLIPPELATAFSISPEPRRSAIDVNRASQDTLSSIRGQLHALSSSGNVNFKSFNDEEADPTMDGSDPRKLRRIEAGGGATEDDAAENGNDDAAARAAAAMKRPRLVWTPQLHKRFVEVVAHLGIKNAVPKTIMQLMNVEGLTRENVASHLQKYRLYLKRMQGLSSEGPSASDPLFASTPVPQSFHESGAMVPETKRRDAGTWSGGSVQGYGNGQVQVPIPMPYPPQMMHMPVFGMAHGNGHLGMPMGNPATPGSYHGFESHPYSMVPQRDWSGNKFGSFASYQHVTPNDK